MKGSDLVMALTPLVEALEELQIRYYIGGSVASSMHGVARATADVDLLAEMSVDDARGIVTRLESQYYVSLEMIQDAIGRSSCFNVIHLATMIKLDVFVRTQDPHARIALDRSLNSKLDESTRSFEFATAEDIVLLKLQWFRKGGEVSERQWRDVLGVMRVQTALDFDYMRRWGVDLAVSDLLERAIVDSSDLDP